MKVTQALVVATSMLLPLLAAEVSANSFTFHTSDSQFVPGNDNQGLYYGCCSSPGVFRDTYGTGRIDHIEFRSFFTFDLSTLAGTVTGATLALRRYGVYRAETTETIGFYDVTTDAVTLNTNTALSPSIFDDLGSGESYGTFPFSTTGSSRDILYFPLNSNAINDINNLTGDFFSIGAALLSLPAGGFGSEYLFYGSSGLGVQSLILEIAIDLDPIDVYDDFNAKSFRGVKRAIDVSKWAGADRGSKVGEVERKIKAKRAYFKIRSWGNDTEDSGLTTGVNRLIFKKDAGSITGVCFRPRIKKYENNKCTNSTEHSEGGFEYWGTMYDSNAQEDNENGNVYAFFKFGRSTVADEGGINKSKVFAFAGAYQCADDACDTVGWTTWNTGTTDPDLGFGEFNKNNKTEFCAGYDSANKQLVFSAGSDIRVVDIATHGLPAKVAGVHPNQVWHALEAGVGVANCQTDGMLPGYLEGDIDSVKVRRKP